MANIKSAQKRIKQNEKRRMRNKQGKSEIKTAARKVLKSLESPQAGESAASAGLYKSFVRKIDRAASANVVHWKTAARKKSRLAKKINAAGSKQK